MIAVGEEDSSCLKEADYVGRTKQEVGEEMHVYLVFRAPEFNAKFQGSLISLNFPQLG